MDQQPQHKEVDAHEQVPVVDKAQNTTETKTQHNTKVDDATATKIEDKVSTTVQKPKQKIEEKTETSKKTEQINNKATEQKKQQKTIQQKKVETKTEAKKEEPQKKKQTMKSIMLSGPKTYKVVEIPIPKPASGQVLVKVMAAPINPSDLALFNGHYSHQKKFPTVMGFQGAGIVVESGGGLMGWGIVGKKVAFAAQKEGQGTYSQYVLVKSEQCLPLSDDTSFEQGAMSVINPLTAIALLDIVKSKKQKCVVITAAASALGRIMNRLYPKQGVEVINIVRRAQQVQLLKGEGAKYVINSTDPNFQTQLRVLADKMGARTCFQAIGGDFTAVVTRNMPKMSTITVYGCLSQKNISGLQVMDLLANQKTVNGFLLPQWLKTKNTLTLLPVFYKVRSTITQDLKSNVAKKFKLQQLDQAVQFYLKNMSEGKVLMQPWSE